MINFLNANNKADDIELLANLIWNEHFLGIITQEQIDYMLETFQSKEAIEEAIKFQDYNYFLIKYNDDNIGYFAYKFEENKIFLSKIYISKDYRGQGISSMVIEFIKELAIENNFKSIYLTCNKHNKNSLAVYEHLGFKNIDSKVSDIGNGYVMDDYIYSLDMI